MGIVQKIRRTAKRAGPNHTTTKSSDRRAAPGGVASRPPAGLSSRTVRQYGANYSDTAVAAIGQEDGNASLSDSGVWGPNATKVWAVRMFNRAHGVNMHLIGHQLREALVGVYHALDHAVPAAKTAEQDALDSVDEHTTTAVEKERKRQEIRADGLSFPHWIAHSGLYAAVLLGLVIGDLAFIAVAFQLFGLSDAKILGLPWSDELHIAASASVLALVVLAHVAGKHIRAIAHDIDRHRKAKTDEEREAVPEPSRVSMAIASVCLIAAFGLLVGIAQIRAGYLVESGVNAHTLPFFLIQLAVFSAALAVAIAHAHPHGREWVDLSRRERDADRKMRNDCEIHVEAIGEANGLVDQGNALIAQAGHHAGASREDVVRQAAEYVRRHLLSVPEPSENEMFPGELELPEQPADEKLATFLVGITGLPQIPRLTTDRVTTRRDEARELLRKLRFAEAESDDTEKATPGDGGVEGEQDPNGSTVTINVPPTSAIPTNGGVKA